MAVNTAVCMSVWTVRKQCSRMMMSHLRYLTMATVMLRSLFSQPGEPYARFLQVSDLFQCIFYIRYIHVSCFAQ